MNESEFSSEKRTFDHHKPTFEALVNRTIVAGYSFEERTLVYSAKKSCEYLVNGSSKVLNINQLCDYLRKPIK